MRLRRPSQNVQKSLNRRPVDHPNPDAIPPRAALDRLDHPHQGCIGEIQPSKIEANTGSPSIQRAYDGLDQLRLA